MSQNTKLIDAIKAASQRWKEAFNAGNASGCAACYEESATMKVTPMGTFEGRSEIQAFWEKLIADGFAEVEYLDPRIEVLNENTGKLSSGWKMNKAHGVISKEVWVLQENGQALLREDAFEVQG